MADLPAGVARVVPANVAPFTALQWLPDGRALDSLIWMGDQFGWSVSLLSSGQAYINARHTKKYRVRPGQWVIAVGTNGSLRVCTDREYRRDYKEVEA